NMTTIQASPNYKKGKFKNPVPTVVMKEGTTWDTMKRWFSDSDTREPSGEFDFSVNSFSPSPISENGLGIIWVGHSTLLIEIDGKRFLTDPMWSKRASPVGFAGPARFFPPPLTLEQLPKLDGVIISHDHLDHLDSATVQKLASTDVMFYTPLGVGRHLTSWGISETRIKELDWWDQISVGNDHELIAAPARHFSGRGLFDRNETQWCSWVIKGKSHKVFFGGDSGLFPGFKTIGDKYGPFDITFLEIGAHDANWPDIHLGPHHAIEAHLDLRGKVLLPIHWGLFNLAFHAWDEPVETLLKVARERKVSLSLPVPGRYINAPELGTISHWWRSISKS
ncbi:MAG: hypothetical protein HN580_21530, partial [Deltaproteobacteria bacterium]|nr:hypothetical protein [Deltaproteobacteria bacterium]